MFKLIVESIIALLNTANNLEAFAHLSFFNSVKSLIIYSIKCVSTNYLAREQVLILKLLLKLSIIVH